MISIILIEPETSGNVGAVARVMANFDVKDLILVDPRCDHLDEEAMNRACHAKSILKKAKVESFDDIKRFNTLIATTSKTGSDYNVPRVPISPNQLAKKPDKKIALVFGREGKGLSNKEVEMCDFSVTIPASSKYSALNLSHSVAIILYELFKEKDDSEKRLEEKFIPASKTYKDVIQKKLDLILNQLNFATKEKKDTQKLVWKRIFGKSFLTKREAFAVLGFFRKLEERLKKK